LCEQLGYPHPDYLLQAYPDLTVEQLDEWEVYSRYYGFRNDVLWAYLTQMVAAPYSEQAFNIDKFMPYKETLPEEVAESVNSWIKGR